VHPQGAVNGNRVSRSLSCTNSIQSQRKVHDWITQARAKDDQNLSEERDNQS